MEDKEQIICQICNEEVCEEKYVGCCSDGLCKFDIEFMCDECAKWIEEEEVWLCNLCVEQRNKNK